MTPSSPLKPLSLAESRVRVRVRVSLLNPYLYLKAGPARQRRPLMKFRVSVMLGNGDMGRVQCRIRVRVEG